MISFAPSYFNLLLQFTYSLDNAFNANLIPSDTVASGGNCLSANMASLSE
jgi:hypothetical protein